MANTKAQIDALRRILSDGEWHKRVDLPECVRDDRAWRDVDPAKLGQTVVDRLKMIRDEIETGEMPGPRGSILRLVRRKPIPSN